MPRQENETGFAMVCSREWRQAMKANMPAWAELLSTETFVRAVEKKDPDSFLRTTEFLPVCSMAAFIREACKEHTARLKARAKAIGSKAEFQDLPDS